MGPDAMILVFWMLSFKPTFSLSSFTFLKRFFNSYMPFNFTFTFHFHALEKELTTHSCVLAWKIPLTEEPGWLQSMGSRRVRHDWATSFSLFTFMHWRRKWQPTPVFLLENLRDGGAWWAAIYEVTQSQTEMKWLSSNSSSYPLLTVWQTTYKPQFAYL